MRGKTQIYPQMNKKIKKKPSDTNTFAAQINLTF